MKTKGIDKSAKHTSQKVLFRD